MSRLKEQFPAQVCEKKCSTCVFGPNSPIGKQRFRELSDSWKDFQGHQSCHKYGTTDGGKDVWCRGFYDTLPILMRRTFEALGYIIFVESDPHE